MNDPRGKSEKIGWNSWLNGLCTSVYKQPHSNGRMNLALEPEEDQLSNRSMVDRRMTSAFFFRNKRIVGEIIDSSRYLKI